MCVIWTASCDIDYFMCVTCRIQMCERKHVWRDAFILQLDSFICMKIFTDIALVHVYENKQRCTRLTMNIYVRHDSFICVT